MNINTSVTSQSNRATAGEDTGPAKSGNAAPQTGGNTVTNDRLTLSETARLINSPGKISTTHPAPDLARIAGIKLEISAGTFNTDPARIAARFHQFNMNLK